MRLTGNMCLATRLYGMLTHVMCLIDRSVRVPSVLHCTEQ